MRIDAFIIVLFPIFATMNVLVIVKSKKLYYINV